MLQVHVRLVRHLLLPQVVVVVVRGDGGSRVSGGGLTVAHVHQGGQVHGQVVAGHHVRRRGRQDVLRLHPLAGGAAPVVVGCRDAVVVAAVVAVVAAHTTAAVVAAPNVWHH